jgi:predicted site-specific integrase-resolvase
MHSASRSPVRHLNQVQLSDRWSISPRTLERWRWIGEGPVYLKIGGRVVYRLEDVERYERECLRGDMAVLEQGTRP